jgi:hypothetical protein
VCAECPSYYVPEHSSCHGISGWAAGLLYNKSAVLRNVIKGTPFVCVRACMCVESVFLKVAELGIFMRFPKFSGSPDYSHFPNFM